METTRYEPPPFPRPVSGFVGRDVELARVRALLPREALFLIYGVAGIGKSEFVYKMVEEARALAPLRRAPALAVSVRAGQHCDHVFSIVRSRLGAAEAEAPAGLADDLGAVAKALEARPTLVFIDDAHNLDAEALGEALGYLARHVARSRIFVASRLELLLPPDTPPPAVCRLRPLGYEAVAAMVAGLGETLGFDPPDPGAVFERSGGSPFYVRRELADRRYVPRRGADSLAASLRDLDPPLRRALLLTRLVRGRLGPADLGGGEALWELARRFLVDVDRGVVIVHDLIGEALLREAPPHELADARRDAARLLLQRAEAAPPERAAELALDVVEAARHLSAAGEAAAAWQALERWQRPLARAGLDHLALEFLPALQAALPEQSAAVAFGAAQTLVRHGRLAEAQALLAQLVVNDPAQASSPGRLRLEAQLAQRAGAPDRAAALLERALPSASEPDERLSIALALANARSRLGAAREARRALGWARRVRDDEGRVGRARALSFLCEGRFPEAAAAAARAAARLPEGGRDGEAARAQLASLELVARCAGDELESAAMLLKRVQRHEVLTSALPSPTRLVCEGLVHHARGHLVEARAALGPAHERLSARGDPLLAATAGHWLALTLVGLGDDEGAQAAAQATARQAIEGGLRCLATPVALLMAQMHLRALRPREAEAALTPLVVAGEAERPWVRAQVQTLVAHALGLRGEAEAARAALERAAALVRQEAVEARRRAFELAAAEVLLLCGDAVGAWARAEAAQAYYEARGRRHPQAQAALLRAAALVALASALSHESTTRPPAAGATGDDEPGAGDVMGDEGDAAAVLGEAEAQLALAQEFAERHGYALPWAPLIASALARRRGEGRRTADRNHAGASALADWPGLALLRRLLDPPPAVNVDPPRPSSPQSASASGQGRDYDLVVDLKRNVIYGPDATQQVGGRPLLCALLAHLTPEGGGQSAEHLFYEVWGGREYHPLRHRNTIHVAIMRLRRALHDLLPGREVVETTPQGWRLAPGVSRLVLRNDDAPSPSPTPTPTPPPPSRRAGPWRERVPS